MANRTVDLGIFTAYGEAREAGYEGSKAEFEEGLKKAAEAYDEAEAAVAAAAQSATEAAASAVDASTAAAEADSSADAAQESETAADVSASAAASSAVDASESASDAATAKTAAETAQTAAEAAATAADGSKTAAAGSASAAASSATAAAGSATAATSSATAAAESASDAAASATAAVGSATDAAASATDAAESATKAEQAASTIGYTKWADLERRNGNIRSSDLKWANVSSTRFQHVLIPINPGESGEVTAPTSNYITFAFLISDAAPVLNEDAPLCAGTGITQISANRHATFTTPEDARFLYMYATYDNTPLVPQLLKIEGVDILTNVAGNIGGLDARVSRLEALVDYIAMMADIDISGV